MKIEVPILPLAVGTAIKSLQFGGIDVSNLGSGIGPMAFVPPGADSAKAKAAQLADLETLQSAEFAAGNMSVSDSVALSKTEGYLAEDFVEGEVQIKSFTPSLASMIGPKHPLVGEYIASRDYIKTNKIRFYKALTTACGTTCTRHAGISFSALGDRILCDSGNQYNPHHPLFVTQGPSYVENGKLNVSAALCGSGSLH